MPTQTIRHVSRFLVVLLIMSALGLGACSSKDKNSKEYTFTATTSSLNSPISINVRGTEGFQIAPSESSSNEFTTKFKMTNLSAGDISIREQPDNQSCYLYPPSINDSSRTVELSLVCQNYQYGASGITDFAVGNDKTCAVIESRVECMADDIESIGIDFDAEYQNPRLLTIGSLGHFCFLDDNGLYCSDNDLFNPEEIYQNAENIREMELGLDTLCYIDDNGLSCAGESFLDSESAAELEGPHSLVVSAKGGGCVLDVNGKLFCWGWLREGESLNAPGRVYEKVGAHSDNICAYGSDGTFCLVDRLDYTLPETQEEIGTVVDFVMTELNTCAVTLSQHLCWDNPFPEQTEVFRNVLTAPEKVEYAPNYGKGCALENERLVCFGDLEQIDFNKLPDYPVTLPIVFD